MAIYENYPRGAMLVSHTATGTIPGDFVIGHMGSGHEDNETKRTQFTKLIQYAADSKHPFLAFYEADPGSLLDQYQSLNLDHWKEADPLTNWSVKYCIDKSLMAGTAKRTVHGMIISMNKVSRKRSDTSTIDYFPVGWVIATAEYLAWAIWKLYQLPVWFYMDAKTADSLAGRGSQESAQMAAFLQKWGISTYVDSMTPQGESVTALPVPPDSLQALLRAACLPTLGNGELAFVCYSTGDYSITGVAGGVVPLFTYLGSKAALYDLLGWKDAPVVTPPPGNDPPPDDDGGDGGGTVDLSGVVSRLDTITARLDAILAELKRERTLK